MSTEAHARLMRRAVTRARRARHRTSPNPKVGCVIVKDGQIIGEGVTRPVGGPHAEAVAIAAAGAAARGADMYVTLEPCCHHGRTAPCTGAIIAAGLGRVFIGVADPNPLVAGGGIRQLREAGVEVVVGVLGEVCAAEHAPFFRFITEGRPWVVLKAAVTLDGRIATEGGDSRWITGPEARTDVHRLRAWADAVFIGGRTARQDDPQLTVRHVRGDDPLRVVADTELGLEPTMRVLGPGSLVLHADDAEQARIDAFHRAGARTVAVPRTGRGLAPRAMLRALAAENVVAVLLEGGGRLHGSFLQAGLVDEACIYVAPRFLGRGRPVIDLPSVADMTAGWELADPRTKRLGGDVRIRGRMRYPEGAICSPV